MKRARAFIAFLAILVISSPFAQAWPIQLLQTQNLQIKIIPNKSVYLQGERASFKITFQENILGVNRNIKIPNEQIVATFPDARTRVDLIYRGNGIYSYVSPVLNNTGNYTLKIIVCSKRRLFPINNILAERSCTIPVVQLPPDRTPPVVIINQPSDNFLTNQNTINISGTYVERNLSGITVNGIPAIVRSGTFSLNGFNLSEGNNVITAAAVDRSGNRGTSAITVVLDTIPPQNPAASVAQGEYTRDNVINLNLTAQDASEMIISENIDFAGVVWEPYLEAKSFNVSSGDGEKSIWIKYRDRAQNETTPVSDMIILDATAPIITITRPSNSLITDQNIISISGNYDEVNLSDITINGNQALHTSGIFTYEGYVLNEGSNIITAIATDRSGNIGINSIDVILNTIPPTNIKPESRGAVQLRGRSLFVGGSSFIVKGVTYQPTPVGFWPSVEAVYTLENCNRDFRLLRDMGCNTIRTYSIVNAVLLDKAQEYDIKVCAGFWVRYDIDLSDPVERENIIADFRVYVRTFKDHPALLLWSLGNEQNYQNGNNPAWYSLANELARMAYEEEGEGYHPVAIVNGGIENIGRTEASTDDVSLNYVDIWGVNVYVGYSFIDNPNYTDFFEEYANKSNKPLWISEYGIDAFDNMHGIESQKRQAAWDSHNWDEITGAPICIGATLMSYSDEWWKADNILSQDNGGYPTSIMTYPDCHPDGYSNEEWWGIMKWQNGQLVPRMAYYALMKRWANVRNGLVVDDYNDGTDPNFLGGYSFVFDSPGSINDFCGYSYLDIDGNRCLSISYNTADSGSWAGYYTLTGGLDARRYDALTFMVKGGLGSEILKVGLRDSAGHESKINLPEYLPQGVSTSWQRVVIPLTTFGGSVDLSSLENISIVFENQIGSGEGSVYIDNLGFGAVDYRHPAPLAIANFNSSLAHGQNAIGANPVILTEGLSLLNHMFGLNEGDNTSCLRLNYTINGGTAARWMSFLNFIDVSPYKYLSFFVKGENGGEVFHIYMEDRWHNRYYKEVENITQAWQEIKISLDEFIFHGVDITDLLNIEIIFEWEDGSGTIYADDIKFRN